MKEIRQAADGYTEIVDHVRRECDLRGRTVPTLGSRRVSYPFVDNLTRLNQYDEPALDVGIADFDVLDMGYMDKTEKITKTLEGEKVRFITETTTLVQWSVLWPVGKPRPREY